MATNLDLDLDDLDHVVADDYLRVSVDKSGNLRSNREQHDENLELCARKGWTFGRSYADEGSASEFARRKRDGFAELVAALRDGSFAANVLIVWEASRGTRRAGEMESLLGLLQDRGVWVYVVNKRRLFNPHVVDDWEDLMVAAVKAAAESMRTSQRVKRATKADAKAGRAFTGGRRAFGFDTDGVSHHPTEAPIVRECVRRFLAGESVRSLAADLNRRGVTTTAGNEWHPGPLGAVIAAPRNAGHRVHNREVVKRDAWVGIIDDATHRRVLATLADRKPTGRRGRTPRLLSSILRCGKCGAVLVGNTDTRGVRRYQCRKGPGYNGCGGLGIKAVELEDLLGALATERLADVEARRAAIVGPDDSPELAELDAIEARLLAVDDDVARGELDNRDANRRIAAIKRHRDEVEARLAAKVREAAPLNLVDVEGFVGRPWASLEQHEQRRILDALVDHVTVAPASVIGSTAFEGARVTGGDRIVWKF